VGTIHKKTSLAKPALPRLAITLGDPAGIGPEIVLKAVADNSLRKICAPVIVGDLQYLSKLARELKLKVNLRPVPPFGDDFSLNAGSEIAVHDMANLKRAFPIGELSKTAGKASFQYVKEAVRLCRKGVVDGIVTAPINKKSWWIAGYDLPGHTELLARLTGTEKFAMSFFAGKLRVVLLSTHLPLQKAIKKIKKKNLVELAIFTDRELSKTLGRPIRIALAGVNPHASENGLFGSEENNEMLPAVRECRAKYGINIEGPFSADTIFLRAFRGEFDAVIACYHDQATLPVKCLTFGQGVNVTLGLPIIRTSVDHGTAFDIAGKDMADPSSLKAAVRVAAELSRIKIENFRKPL
jgi:4-hydroxythreonine-4-phosphate dehydrogenase